MEPTIPAGWLIRYAALFLLLLPITVRLLLITMVVMSILTSPPLVALFNHMLTTPITALHPILSSQIPPYRLHRQVCSRAFDIRDALDCLGGIKVLMPLLSYITQGWKSDDNASSSKSVRGKITGGDGKNIGSQVVDVLLAFLTPSAENDKLITVRRGFVLLASFLSSLPPHLKSMQVGARLLSFLVSITPLLCLVMMVVMSILTSISASCCFYSYTPHLNHYPTLASYHRY